MTQDDRGILAHKLYTCDQLRQVFVYFKSLVNLPHQLIIVSDSVLSVV